MVEFAIGGLIVTSSLFLRQMDGEYLNLNNLSPPLFAWMNHPSAFTLQIFSLGT